MFGGKEPGCAELRAARAVLFGKLIFEELVEDSVGLGADENLAIDEVSAGVGDEESGSTGDAESIRVSSGLLDVSGEAVTLDAGFEALEIELGDLLGVVEYGGGFELGGVGDEEVAKLPELVLISGAAGSLGGFGGVGVEFEGEIPGDEAELSGVDPVALDLVKGAAVEAAAEGALVVRELDHGEGCVAASEDGETGDAELGGLRLLRRLLRRRRGSGRPGEKLTNLAKLLENLVSLVAGDTGLRGRGRAGGLGEGRRAENSDQKEQEQRLYELQHGTPFRIAYGNLVLFAN